MSIKTVRVYHDKGLLPEPERDTSGYRRNTAQHVIELVQIRTLAGADVPLARMRQIKTAPDGWPRCGPARRGFASGLSPFLGSSATRVFARGSR